MNYREYYANFLEEHDQTNKSGAQIGDAICRMVNYFMEVNTELAKAETNYYSVKADISNQMDDKTGKQISATKAEMLAHATDEFAAENELRKNLENCEQAINGLKSMLKGAVNEYAHIGAT